MPKKTKTKYTKLTRRERELAGRSIAEEMQTRKYPRKQAIAIGISRARSEARREEIQAIVNKYARR